MFCHVTHRQKLLKTTFWLVLICLLPPVSTALAAHRGMQKSDAKHMPREAILPAGKIPDNIVLTFGQDPTTSQFINWRTSMDIKDGMVQYRELRAWDSSIAEKKAYYVEIFVPNMAAQPEVKRFMVPLTKLKPNTAYQYRVGSKSADKWSPWHKFVTAPVFGSSFSFVTVGDVHTSYDQFAKMLSDMERRHSNINFYMLVGDLVENGENRNQWDSLLNAGANVFAGKPIVAAMGDNDSRYFNDKDKSLFFTEYFHYQPESTPAGSAKNVYIQHAFSFTYSNACFIVLNTNDSTKEQKIWLEQELIKAKESPYQWIIVMFHHPVYPVHTQRTYTDLQEQWAPLFDKYGVDLVLTGHDHAYMRTDKIFNHKPVDNNAAGTVYVIINSSEKHFPAKYLPQTKVAVKDMPLYAKIDCSIDHGGKTLLHFRALTLNGDIVDEFKLEK